MRYYLLISSWQLSLTVILAVIILFLLLFALGMRYTRSSIRSAKAEIAAGNYAAAEEKFRGMRSRSFGANKVSMEYYLAYTYLAAKDYEKFFAAIEAMRTYRSKVTKVYRTDCAYLLLIARLRLRDAEGAEKALTAFRSAVASDKWCAKRFGSYDSFFAAALACVRGRGTKEDEDAIRPMQKDGDGSILIALLARELVSEDRE